METCRGENLTGNFIETFDEKFVKFIDEPTAWSEKSGTSAHFFPFIFETP